MESSTLLSSRPNISCRPSARRVRTTRPRRLVRASSARATSGKPSPFSSRSTNTLIWPPQGRPTCQAVSSATPNSSVLGLPLARMSSASAITSPSTQPPETEPSKRPSGGDHQLAADADRRRAPGADHGGERDAAVLVEPAARGFQHVVRLGAVEGGGGLGHGMPRLSCSVAGKRQCGGIGRHKHKRHRPSPPVPSSVRYIRAGRAPASSWFRRAPGSCRTGCRMALREDSRGPSLSV